MPTNPNVSKVEKAWTGNAQQTVNKLNIDLDQTATVCDIYTPDITRCIATKRSTHSHDEETVLGLIYLNIKTVNVVNVPVYRP